MSATVRPKASAGGNRLAMAFAGLLLVSFAVVAVMLATDKNLQTNFGAQSPYYVHWYGVLAIAIGTLALGALILVVSRGATQNERSVRLQKFAVTGGFGWAILVVLASVGVLATYGQVGFTSASQFANYLFGVTAYAGVESYIPWLYDLMLAMFLLSAAVGAIVFLRLRAPPNLQIAGTSSTEAQ